MAVDVIRTIASRSFMICGSGTVSTWTVFRPDQTVARILDSLVAALLRRLLGEMTGRGVPLGRALRADNLARFQDLLEAAQVVPRLLLGVGAGQLAHGRPDRTAFAPLEVEVKLDGAVARRIRQHRHAGAGEWRLVAEPPAHPAGRLLLDRFDRR